jgi:uncharacterized protein (DUF2461 family)
MKHQAMHSFVTDDQPEQMVADMAIKFMRMTLFQIVSEMADNLRRFRSDVHKELTDLVTTLQTAANTAGYRAKASSRHRHDPRRQA